MENNSAHEHCTSRQALQRSLYHRAASLTNVEKTFLSALLIDRPSTHEEEQLHKKKIEKATEVLNDGILFSVPLREVSTSEEDGKLSEESTLSGADQKLPSPPKSKRSNVRQLDLW